MGKEENQVNKSSRRYQRYQEKIQEEKRRKRKPFIVLGVILLLAAAVTGLWYLDYRKDDPIRTTLDAAKAGDAKAQFDVALEYLNGTNVDADSKKGVKWLKKSANQKYAEAMSYLGVYKLYGAVDEEADLPGAVELFKGAAEQGNEDAKLYLANIYLTKDLDYFNSEEAVSLLNALADEDSTTALNFLGSIYSEGDVVDQDYKKAAEYYQRAVDLEDMGASYELGLLYIDGNGVEKDEAKGLELIQKAAEGGNAQAKSYLETPEDTEEDNTQN